MQQYGMPALGMFELTPVGLPILIVGVLYMYFIGRRLIPEREAPPDPSAGRAGPTYLTELLIQPGSSWAGKRLSQTGLREALSLEVVRVIRSRIRYLAPRPELLLQEGDVLLVEGPTEQIIKIKTTAGIDIKADARLGDDTVEDADNSLAEAILLVGSPLIGRTLKGFNFRERYGVRVLAVHRRGEDIRRKISQIPLRIGDVLLVEGDRFNIHALEEENVLRVLSALEGKIPNQKNAPIAVAAFLAPILLSAFEIVSFPVAVFLGVLVIFLTRTLAPEEAYRQVEWRAVFLIGSMLGLGTAIESTGTARFLAANIVQLVGGAGPLSILSMFFGLTVLLTQPMSNQAAAVVVAPVAFQTAAQLGLDPRPFAIMIALAASTSYVTPLEPACLMVYGPGNYRFFDFLKVGLPLTVIIYLIAITLVPLLWPF